MAGLARAREQDPAPRVVRGPRAPTPWRCTRWVRGSRGCDCRRWGNGTPPPTPRPGKGGVEVAPVSGPPGLACVAPTLGRLRWACGQRGVGRVGSVGVSVCVWGMWVLPTHLQPPPAPAPFVKPESCRQQQGLFGGAGHTRVQTPCTGQSVQSGPLHGGQRVLREEGAGAAVGHGTKHEGGVHGCGWTAVGATGVCNGGVHRAAHVQCTATGVAACRRVAARGVLCAARRV